MTPIAVQSPPPHRPSADAWEAHMRGGRFEDAWRISDAALAARAGRPCWDRPRHLQYVWDGRPLAGRRVLVRCYHGLGDTIQFVRYASLLRATASEVIVWAQPALLPLLRPLDGIDRLLPLHDGAPDVEYDVDVEVMELPHVFRTTRDTIPAAVPYLKVPPARRQSRDRLNVGLVWKAGEWDDRRSVPFDALAPLAGVPGIRWHVLQQNAAAAGWRSGFGQPAGSDDLLGLAGVLRSLDLVISVDSMPAHLAGALGVPAWVLLRHEADWRWGDADRTPWYPATRLLRQSRPDDWSGVVRKAAAALSTALPGRIPEVN